MGSRDFDAMIDAALPEEKYAEVCVALKTVLDHKNSIAFMTGHGDMDPKATRWAAFRWCDIEGVPLSAVYDAIGVMHSRGWLQNLVRLEDRFSFIPTHAAVSYWIQFHKHKLAQQRQERQRKQETQPGEEETAHVHLSLFGAFVRRERMAKGLILGDMAKFLDISSAELSAMEMGKKRLPQQVIFAMQVAEFLGLDQRDGLMTVMRIIANDKEPV